MKKIKNLLLLAIAVISFIVIAKPQETYAADSYKPIKMEEGGIYKVGKYYLKYVYNEQKVYVANSKNGNYILTPMPHYGLYTNGKTVYYIKFDAVYKYDLAKKKNTLVKKLGKIYSNDLSSDFKFVAYYSGNFYIRQGSFEKYKYTSYCFNMKSKKIKKLEDKCGILSQKGKYVIATKDYRTDTSYKSEYVYQLTKSGMKRIKLITPRGFSATFVGKSLYYVEYNHISKSGNKKYYDMKRAVLYKSSITGKKRKKIASFYCKGDYAQVIVDNITSKNCQVFMSSGMNSKRYLYTYKTKKLVEIRK